MLATVDPDTVTVRAIVGGDVTRIGTVTLTVGDGADVIVVFVASTEYV